MKKAAVLLFLFQISVFAQLKQTSPCNKPLGDVNTYAVVYYADRSLSELAKFDMVVLDPANYDASQIAKLKSMGCIPIGYLNVGEVETYRGYFDMVDTSIMLSPDPNWKDRYYVNLSDPLWTRIVIKDRVPELLRMGFCGVFVDFAGLLHEYPDLDSSAAALVRHIRRSIGTADMIVDGALPIMNKIGNYTDAIAVEGLMGYYDFNTDSYRLRRDSVEDRETVSLLAAARRFRIKIFQLDYAAPHDLRARDEIILRSREIGFVPYVGTIELDTLFTNTIHKLKIPESKSKKPFPD